MYRLSLGLSSCLPFFLFHNVCVCLCVSVCIHKCRSGYKIFFLITKETHFVEGASNMPSSLYQLCYLRN